MSLINREIQFTGDAQQNKKTWDQTNFSYYTLAKLQESTGYVFPSPETMALAVQNGAKGNLTLDDLGNFVGWQ